MSPFLKILESMHRNKSSWCHKAFLLAVCEDSENLWQLVGNAIEMRVEPLSVLESSRTEQPTALMGNEFERGKVSQGRSQMWAVWGSSSSTSGSLISHKYRDADAETSSTAIQVAALRMLSRGYRAKASSVLGILPRLNSSHSTEVLWLICVRCVSTNVLFTSPKTGINVLRFI